MAATVILVIITASVMAVVNNSIEDMIDNESKLKAFKIARENMETLLGQDNVSEMVEFGSLEGNSDIEWELAVESFSEPINNEMWIRAVSTASYSGVSGDREYIELTHWLTDLTAAQIKQIQAQQKLENDFMDEILVNPYGDDAQGLLMFQEALASDGKFRQAAKIAIQLMQEYPDSFEAEDAAANAQVLARRFARTGNYTIAAEISLAIAAAFPEAKIGDQALDDTMKYANDAAKDGYYKDAAEIANRIAEENPDNEKAQKALDRIYPYAQMAADEGDFQSALAIVEAMEENHPEIKQPPIITQSFGPWKEAAIIQPDPPKESNDSIDDPKPNRPDGQNNGPIIDFLEGRITLAEYLELVNKK